MGTEISKVAATQDMLGTSPVTRYEVKTDVRYRGTFKHYVYVSEEYGVEIDPSNTQNPITACNPEAWAGMSNPKKIVHVKMSVLVLCRDFLKARELVTNEIQKTFSVD
jgi:hypothetical protein